MAEEGEQHTKTTRDKNKRKGKNACVVQIGDDEARKRVQAKKNREAERKIHEYNSNGCTDAANTWVMRRSRSRCHRIQKDEGHTKGLLRVEALVTS